MQNLLLNTFQNIQKLKFNEIKYHKTYLGTHAPVTFTPRASAASCTFKPYMPLPQNDGISDGWIFRMRRGHFFVKFSLPRGR